VISTSLTVWWSVTHVDDMGIGPRGSLGGVHVAVADWFGQDDAGAAGARLVAVDLWTAVVADRGESSGDCTPHA
jgi:hypothetical protein